MTKDLLQGDLVHLSDNQIIFYIDKSWQSYFFKIINSVLVRFPGIPESSDGIYWEFMAIVPRIFRGLKLEPEQGFKTILGTKCRYFTFNKCRAWSTRKHKALNSASSFEDSVPVVIFDVTAETPSPSFSPNLQLLIPLEREVYERVFNQNETVATVARGLGLTRYKVNLIYAQIVKKMREDFSQQNRVLNN